MRPPRSNDGSDDERSLIADAAGGMLVDFFAGQVDEIEDFTGVKHGFGERGDLGAVQAAKPRGHEPSGHLIIENFAAGVTGDEKSISSRECSPESRFLRMRSTARMRQCRLRRERNIGGWWRQRSAICDMRLDDNTTAGRGHFRRMDVQGPSESCRL